MKAEERADLVISQCIEMEGMNFDAMQNLLVQHIQAAEQQARKEALELAAVICDSKAGQRNNEGAMAQECSGDIRALIEREAG